MSIVLKCHKGIGEKVQGTALVSGDNFSARYDLDRIKGVFSRPAHDLHGESYDKKILVMNTAKGGVASAWMLNEMKSRDIYPQAILFNAANTILAQGAALADLSMCDRFEDGDVTQLIKTGDEVIVDPEAGTVTILNRL
jgi:predicted aconitase with swiveling domain